MQKGDMIWNLSDWFPLISILPGFIYILACISSLMSFWLNTTLYGYAYFYLSIHWLMEFGLPQFCFQSCFWEFSCMIFWVRISVCISLESIIKWNCWVIWCVTGGEPHCFLRFLYHFTIPLVWESSFSFHIAVFDAF